MSYKSINDILKILQNQARWSEQPLQLVVKSWISIIGQEKAAHTRPIAIQRDVLRVATSSAAWAQTLTFERQHLLAKLNTKLPTPLVDIHFSTAGWHQSKQNIKQQPTPSNHPSYLGVSDRSPYLDPATPEDAATAFQNWANNIKSRSLTLPLCPECQCPTPPGELQRWSVCSLCAAKKWNT